MRIGTGMSPPYSSGLVIIMSRPASSSVTFPIDGQQSRNPPAMLVLGIETSCDETGVALYHDRRGLLSHRLHSQARLHADYGGVVPELASRDHFRRLLPLTRALLAETGCRLDEITAVAYTEGPGLAGALLVGAATAHG